MGPQAWSHCSDLGGGGGDYERGTPVVCPLSEEAGFDQELLGLAFRSFGLVVWVSLHSVPAAHVQQSNFVPRTGLPRVWVVRVERDDEELGPTRTMAV